jgi:kynurenine formamidase
VERGSVILFMLRFQTNYIPDHAIEKFEQEYGVIPANSLVIVHTGWSKHWDTPESIIMTMYFPAYPYRQPNCCSNETYAALG